MSFTQSHSSPTVAVPSESHHPPFPPLGGEGVGRGLRLDLDGPEGTCRHAWTEVT